MTDSRDRLASLLDEKVADLTLALEHATKDPPYADIDSNLCARLIREAFEDLLRAGESAPSPLALAVIKETLAEWQRDINGCFVCGGGKRDRVRPGDGGFPCERCMETARHIGAIEGALLRAEALRTSASRAEPVKEKPDVKD